MRMKGAGAEEWALPPRRIGTCGEGQDTAQGLQPPSPVFLLSQDGPGRMHLPEFQIQTPRAWQDLSLSHARTHTHTHMSETCHIHTNLHRHTGPRPQIETHTQRRTLTHTITPSHRHAGRWWGRCGAAASVPEGCGRVFN